LELGRRRFIWIRFGIWQSYGLGIDELESEPQWTLASKSQRFRSTPAPPGSGCYTEYGGRVTFVLGWVIHFHSDLLSKFCVSCTMLGCPPEDVLVVETSLPQAVT
jgi:hypothetical protein